jgi:branched-chain amino acid transport system ATP-binding protein
MNILEIENLEASYDGIPVLSGINIQIEKGSFTAVIGANTAGKSSLLKSISGLMPHLSGTIKFEGQSLTQLRAHEIPFHGIAHVPEGRHIFPMMDVRENLLLGGFVKKANPAEVSLNLENIFDLFPKLKERASQLAGTLSGGEQQMVAIGRALMSSPKLLLLDEPSHGLAPKIVQELHDTLLNIHASGVTILLVEQNTKLALSVANYAFVLQTGKIVLKGQSSTLLNDPRIKEAYLGI